MKTKKNLVVICNSCYPVPTATGLLATNCIGYLTNDYDVRVVSVQNSKKSFYKYPAEGYELYTVGDFRLSMFYDAVSQIRSANGFRRKLYQFMKFLTRVVGWIDRTFIHYDNYRWFECKSYKLLKKLNKEKKIDCIISVSEPIRAHVAAMKFKNKNPDVRWVCYWGDLYASTYFKSNIFFSLKKMRNLEKKIVSNADYILTNDEIYTYYKSICQSNNIDSIPYTLKNTILDLESPENINEKTFIYFGSLSLTMRNPEYMLKLFADSEYTLELYTSGCENLIDKYVQLSNGRIKSFGFVESNVLRDKVMKAKALINLGNINADFIPSKTLELLSYRKPILDIYYEDNSYTPISEYPAILRIKNDMDIPVARQVIDEFLQGTKTVSKLDVCNIFYMHTEERAKTIVKEAMR